MRCLYLSWALQLDNEILLQFFVSDHVDVGCTNIHTTNAEISEGKLYSTFLHILNRLKVHKREKFFGSDFEFFTILLLIKLKY